MGKQFRNLYPEDAWIGVGRSVLENRDGKWIEVTWNGQIRSASGRYNFVRQASRIYISKANCFRHGIPIGHIALAHSKSVRYAGQIQFSRRGKRGLLRWWNNASGHYKPSPEYAHQAGLPMESFRPGLFELAVQSGINVPE